MANKKVNYDTLPPIEPGKRPKVLLCGNGLCRSFPGALDMDSIVSEAWSKEHGCDLPKPDSQMTSEERIRVHPIWGLPFPMQIVAATKDNVQTYMGEISKELKKNSICPCQWNLVSKLLDADFDAILTTNYSLEMEQMTMPAHTDRSIYECYRTTQKQTKQQEEFGIYQCTELPYGNHPMLWHIHGTALRKKSMIMGQLYYGKLLREVITRSGEVIRAYKSAQKSKRSYQPKSWVDYFLLGDVYIVGFGLDFSESDIWWLLNQKHITFPGTKTVLYDSSIKPHKQLMLKTYSVEISPLKLDENDGKEKYIRYYERACADIAAK